MSNLQQRLLTAAVAIPLLVWVFYLGGIWFLLLIELVILIGMNELYALVKHKGLPPLEVVGTLCALGLGLAAYRGEPRLMAPALTAAVLLILALELRTLDLRFAITGSAVTLLGVVYVGFLLSHAILLRKCQWRSFLNGHSGPDRGFFYIILVIAATFLADAGAYFAGRAYGKRKLIPRISPGKTWEGVLGGLAGGTMGVLLTPLVFNLFIFDTGFPLIHAFILGPLLVVVSILGDLFESLLKRDAGIKDSGWIVPGHGGILDRLDSLLFTIPVTYYYITLVLGQ